MSQVVRTWHPAREPGGPLTFRRIVEGGEIPEEHAVDLFVAHYGDGARQDAVDLFGEFGGIEWKALDPAGKILGWVGYFYPEALGMQQAGDL